MSSDTPAEDIGALLRQLDRERRARLASERVADDRLRELVELAASLDSRVETRTEELRLATESASAASRAKRSFLAHLGTALETPMHLVLGNLELIDSSALQPDDIARFDSVVSAANELAGLIEGLMLLAASEGRPFEPTLEARSPATFLESVERRWQRRLTATGQLLITETDDIEPSAGDAVYGDVDVVTDWGRLDTVVDHLLDNVRRHARPGRVTVGAGVSGGLVRLVVTDSGPGIPAEHWDDVLTPFFQIGSDPGAAMAGVGIGLAVASRLVEAVGGTLTVGARGDGTKVTCTLPIERRQSPRAVPA